MELRFWFSKSERKLLPAPPYNGLSTREYVLREISILNEDEPNAENIEQQSPTNYDANQLNTNTGFQPDKIIIISSSKTLTPSNALNIISILEIGLLNDLDIRYICRKICQLNVSDHILYTVHNSEFEIKI